MNNVEQRDGPGLVDVTGVVLTDLLLVDDTVLAQSLRRLVRDATRSGGDDPVAAFNSSI